MVEYEPSAGHGGGPSLIDWSPAAEGRLTENVAGYLPEAYGKRIDAQLAKAFGDVDPKRGLKVAAGIAARLEERYSCGQSSRRA